MQQCHVYNFTSRRKTKYYTCLNTLQFKSALIVCSRTTTQGFVQVRTGVFVIYVIKNCVQARKTVSARLLISVIRNRMFFSVFRFHRCEDDDCRPRYGLYLCYVPDNVEASRVFCVCIYTNSAVAKITGVCCCPVRCGRPCKSSKRRVARSEVWFIL